MSGAQKPDESLKTILLSMSDESMDRHLKDIVRAWSEPPKAIELLRAVDAAIHGSLCTGLVLTVMQHCYERALTTEGLTHEQLVPQATWREPLLTTSTS